MYDNQKKHHLVVYYMQKFETSHYDELLNYLLENVLKYALGLIWKKRGFTHTEINGFLLRNSDGNS